MRLTRSAINAIIRSATNAINAINGGYILRGPINAILRSAINAKNAING